MIQRIKRNLTCVLKLLFNLNPFILSVNHLNLTSYDPVDALYKEAILRLKHLPLLDLYNKNGFRSWNSRSLVIGCKNKLSAKVFITTKLCKGSTMRSKMNNEPSTSSFFHSFFLDINLYTATRIAMSRMLVANGS
ncbi:hypothetical protein BpHYR1_043740 [Brachionus plicatilis]|uniref:RNA-directed DNA polymerase from mobile element jockey-like n=1 Tax=Brachionus plicatilis TaxID=10195 RepID=A0A3M7SQ43_BRAPC|nr:hypothetical protein BpHYR1_043740 [Brachionus plicatilis]